MAVVRQWSSLPVRFGFGHAMQDFLERRTLERVLGAEGRSRIYRVGLNFDF